MGYRLGMENQPYTPDDIDFSSAWIDLSKRIRRLANDIRSRSVGTHLAADTATLAEDVSRLCDHVERIHRDAGALLAQADDSDDRVTVGDVSSALKAEAPQLEAVKIRREGYEMRADFKDIIKALFMWQDDPVERSRAVTEERQAD
jgi:hypothetical protein